MRIKAALTYLVISVFLLGMAGLVQASTITVGHGANYDYNIIQAAINAATHGDTVIVASGTYTGPGNRDIDFNGKAITVRSEKGPELTIIDCNGSAGNEHRGFYFHSGENSTSVLNGFTITNGYVINTHGGGIWCEYSSPVVTKCILSNNTARSVTTGVSAFGGGMCNRYNSSPTVTNCTFAGNSGSWGGGMWNGIGCSPTVTNCKFIGNGGGGGMSNTHNSSPIVTSCTFTGNSSGHGGGMSNIRSSNSIIINCTFSGNKSTYYGGGIWNRASSVVLTNCILWGNSSRGSTEERQIYTEDSPTPAVNYCCVQGWSGALGGIGNFGDDPLLEPDHYHLEYGSPCINAGDPSGIYTGQTDIDSQPRVIDGRVDIGADELRQRILIGLEILGPNEVPENFSAGYKALAHYDDDSTRDVTDSAFWSVEPTMVASIEAGVLTTRDIVEGQLATIRAGYTEGGITVEGQKVIHIFALVGIEISGPDEVTENFSAGYQAIAYYDNDSTKDVTDSAFWEVEPNMYASIDDYGVLTTKDIIKDESATIWASYTEGGVAFEAEKAVMVFAVCPTGTALQFDGLNDYVHVPDDYSLDLGTHDLSFAFWFKTDDSALEAMLGKRSTTTGPHNRVADGYSAALLADGTVNVHFRHSASSDSAVFVTSTASYNDGNWHHLAGVYTRSANIELYVDGVPEGIPGDISYAEGADIDLTQPLAIGCRVLYGVSNEFYFNGSIDEVRIYNRALSGEEIWANMHTRLTGDEAGLIGYWDFDEGEGQIVYDLSGNGNDGQLGSTPNPDVSDPAWIESDAPIGLCTPYLIATAAAKEALKHKRASLKELEAALAQEWTMYEALEQWLVSGDFVDLSKGDIVKAGQRTHSAMQHEEQSIDALEKGIEKLLDSLSALGYGPKPPGSNWPPNVTITKPQNGAKFNPDQKIEIEADAWDYDGSVVSVEFFANGNKIGEDNGGADGWIATWSDHPVGIYDLTVKATDDDGAATTSPIVKITLLEAPGQATNPNPSDGATGVSKTTDLSWTAGTNAVSHNVYFGTTSPGTFRVNQTATTFDPGTMASNTTYYWRIDEVNPSGTTAGIVWTFMTSGAPPPPPPPPPP